MLGCCLLSGSGCGWMARNENAEGVRLYQQGNYLGAVNHFQQALAQQPGSPDGFYNLGATYHQQAKLFQRPADMRAAEQYYHLCLSRDPNHEACQRALAVLLVEEQRGDEAVAQLEAWASRQPANPNPEIELARLCQEHGDLRAAENHLVDALAIDPSNTRAARRGWARFANSTARRVRLSPTTAGPSRSMAGSRRSPPRWRRWGPPRRPFRSTPPRWPSRRRSCRLRGSLRQEAWPVDHAARAAYSAVKISGGSGAIPASSPGPFAAPTASRSAFDCSAGSRAPTTARDRPSHPIPRTNGVFL